MLEMANRIFLGIVFCFDLAINSPLPGQRTTGNLDVHSCVKKKNSICIVCDNLLAWVQVQ